jgi:Fe2+ transport system protein FeoA
VTLRNRPPEEGKKRKPANLYAARSGSRVQVVSVAEPAAGQLARQGLRSGDVVMVRNRAPLGGPILVEVRGAVIALGRALARKVTVRAMA